MKMKSAKKFKKICPLEDKDPVEVYCRIKPPNSEDICCKFIDQKRILLFPPENLQNIKTANIKESEYTFTKVFAPEAKQKTLFKTVAKPLVQDLIDGKNGLIFAYGVTGSGKTYTMNGKSNDEGILIRCLDTLFNSIKDYQTEKFVFKVDRNNGFDVLAPAEALYERTRALQQQAYIGTSNSLSKLPTHTPRKGQKEEFFTSRSPDTTILQDVCEDNGYAVFVSYVEIYNNYIYDLLDEVSLDQINTKQQLSKPLKEDSNHCTYVNGCTEVEIKSTDEALEVLYKGLKKKRMACTVLNAESSRSHAVFNIRLVQAPLDSTGEYVLQEKAKIGTSQLALVDLAGSERTNRTQNQGDRLREAGNINSSLMVLRNCLDILRENQRLFIAALENNAPLNSVTGYRFVPYRDAKLTHLFKNYFEGQGKVKMIVCVNPDGKDFEENLHVVRFAELTQEIQISRPTAFNSNADPSLLPGRRQMAKIIAASSALKNLRWGDDIAIGASHELNSPTPFNRMEVGQELFAGLPVTTSTKIETPSSTPPPVFDLGPALPNIELFEFGDHNMLSQLEQTLEQKRSKVIGFSQLVTSNFEELLGNAQRWNYNTSDRNEIGKLKKDLKEARSIVLKLDKDNLTLQARLADVEKVNTTLNRKLMCYDNSQKNFETILDENELARKKMEKDMERQIKAKEIQMENLLWAKNEKLRQLKKIVAESPGKSGNTANPIATTPLTHNPSLDHNNYINNDDHTGGQGDRYKNVHEEINVIDYPVNDDTNKNNNSNNINNNRFSGHKEYACDEILGVFVPQSATNDLNMKPNINNADEMHVESQNPTFPTPPLLLQTIQERQTLTTENNKHDNNNNNDANMHQQPTTVTLPPKPALKSINKPSSRPQYNNISNLNPHAPVPGYNNNNTVKFLNATPTGAKRTQQKYLTLPQTPGNQGIHMNLASSKAGPKSAGTNRQGHVASVAKMYDARVAANQRGISVANSKHRRSKSVGDLKYIEHKLPYQNKTNEVMKPKLRNVVTTSNVTKKEIKKCDKYILNKQDQTESGDIKTQIYKGDVIRTSSGGRAMIFENDIEVLSHEEFRSSGKHLFGGGDTFNKENKRRAGSLDRKSPRPQVMIAQGPPSLDADSPSRKRLYPDLNEHIITEDAYFKAIALAGSVGSGVLNQIDQNIGSDTGKSASRKLRLSDPSEKSQNNRGGDVTTEKNAK